MSFGRRNNFMDPDFDGRRGRPQASPQDKGNFFSSGPGSDNVPNGLLKTARQTGVLNLANRDLTSVPDKVWQVSTNVESAPGDVSLDRGGDTGPRWWEVEEIRKLLLSANRLEELSEDVGKLEHLSVVDVRDNRLTRLPEAICSLRELRSLNASKNRLTELPDGLAAGCMELAQLCLAGNQLTELPPDIGRLDSLTELDLMDNLLASLPDSLAMLGSLRVLEAGKNRLECLPAGLAYLPALARLGVAGNQLADVPHGPYPALEVLDAADNRLTRPPEIGGDAVGRGAPSELKELRLSNNRITRLTPEMLAPLSSLRHLELRRNCLAELPAELPSLLPNLERLDLTDNDLSSLPNKLGLMDGLKCILVDGNPMRALRRDVLAKGTEAVKKHLASRILENPEDAASAPPQPTQSARGGQAAPEQRKEAPKSIQSLQQQFNLDLSEVRATHALKYSNRGAAAIPDQLLDLVSDLQLTRIDLSTNSLDNLPGRLSQPPFSESLQDLSLRQNSISDLDPGVGCLMCLSNLDLSVNLLTSLPRELSRLTNLRQLTLSANRFEEVPDPVYSLPKLESLLLGHNKIARVEPNRLRAMESLATLDLSNNSLATVPPELGLCQHLRNLHLEGNLFRVPRPAQLARGTAFVLEYLRNRLEGGQS